MPGFLNRHDVPHMSFVAPQAQIKVFFGCPGTFNRACRRLSWALLPDGCVYGLVETCEGDRQPDGEMGFARSGSEGDRLQQLRAVLPCDVRVIAETHPLFGRLLAARSFKRWNGVLMLVVDLPDGSPGTIRADATDVCGVG